MRLCTVVLWVLCSPVWGFSGLSKVSLSPQHVLARLERAKTRQAALVNSLLALDRDLVFLADFEQKGLAFLGNTSFLPLPLSANHYRPGRFGQGYYFEKARHNMLLPSMAHVETDTSAFVSRNGAQLRLAETNTAFGKKALSVSLPLTNAGFEITPVKVDFARQDGSEKVVTLLASCFVKGSKDAGLKIVVKLTPMELPQENPVQDQPIPQDIVLTGDWQRVACLVKADARLREREAVFSLNSASPTPVVLLADGFRFEQASYYPHHHTMPTTWTPGGKTLPATFVDLNTPELREQFPVKEGSITLWTCTPHTSNLTNQGGSTG